MPNRSALNLECVFALKKNWPVTFAVPLDVVLMGNWYGIQKVICFAQLNSTSEGRFPFMTLYLLEFLNVLLDDKVPYSLCSNENKNSKVS